MKDHMFNCILIWLGWNNLKICNSSFNMMSCDLYGDIVDLESGAPPCQWDNQRLLKKTWQFHVQTFVVHVSHICRAYTRLILNSRCTWLLLLLSNISLLKWAACTTQNYVGALWCCTLMALRDARCSTNLNFVLPESDATCMYLRKKRIPHACLKKQNISFLCKNLGNFLLRFS